MPSPIENKSRKSISGIPKPKTNKSGKLRGAKSIKTLKSFKSSKSHRNISRIHHSFRPPERVTTGCKALIIIGIVFGTMLPVILALIFGIRAIATIGANNYHLNSDSLSCRDENGKPIDWTLTYKIPELEKHKDPLISGGLGLMFISSNKNENWTISTESIQSPTSLMGYTVAQVFDKNMDLLIAYNDQAPNEGYDGSNAHAKGLLAFSGDTGFWLMHSVPNFVDLAANKYTYPNSGRMNGQNLFCITMKTGDETSLNTVANHLLMMRPSIYDTKLSPEFEKRFPLFAQVKARKWLTKNVTEVGKIFSANKMEITSFSKNKYFKADIYSDLIATHVQHDMAVQSWRNGAGGKLPADCTDKYKVMNIEELKVNSESDWKYTEDHSKWAVSTTDDKELFCISDINRMHSQFRRGGGALCVRSKNIWKSYRNLALDVDTCPKPNKLSNNYNNNYYKPQRKQWRRSMRSRRSKRQQTTI